MKFTNKIYHIFSRLSVNKQLRTIFLFSVILPIFLFGCFVLVHSNHLMINNYTNLAESNTLRVRSILLDITTHLYNISDEVSYDNDLIQLLTSTNSDDHTVPIEYNNHTLFSDILNKNPSISTLKLYTTSADVPDNDYYHYADKQILETDWYQRASSQAGPFWNTQLREDRLGNQYWELNFYRKIPLVKTKSYAILSMSVSDNYLRNLIENDTLQTIITVNSSPVFYNSTRGSTGTYFPYKINYKKKYYQNSGLMQLDHHPSIASIETLIPYRSNDKIYISCAYTDAISHIQEIAVSYLCILLLAISLPIIIIYFFTKYFSSRVKTLRYAMHKVSSNDYEIMDSVQGDDELSETFSDLLTMVSKIKKSEAKIYEAQITEQQFENKQQQMEYKVLASQINPHFLYNTLETIRMKAFTEGNKEVANAIKLLGKSMRYVLNNTGTTSTTLDKELDYIKTYLSIQKLRFGDRVNYSIIIEGNLDISQYQILPLLLQPIVENAISHGLEKGDGQGILIIKIRRTKNNLLSINIFDNGIGMNKMEFNALEEHMNSHPQDSTSSIGLYNINQRIKLYYGPKYTIKVKSKKHFGTLVVFTIPLYNLQEEDTK